MTDILDLPGWTVTGTKLDDSGYELEAEYAASASGISRCFAATAISVSTRSNVMAFIYFPPLVPKGRKKILAGGVLMCNNWKLTRLLAMLALVDEFHSSSPSTGIGSAALRSYGMRLRCSISPARPCHAMMLPAWNRTGPLRHTSPSHVTCDLAQLPLL